MSGKETRLFLSEEEPARSGKNPGFFSALQLLSCTQKFGIKNVYVH